MQLRKIFPTDNMIQETKEKEFPVLHEGNTEIFANRVTCPVFFGFLISALCKLQYQPFVPQKVADSLNDPKHSQRQRISIQTTKNHPHIQ